MDLDFYLPLFDHAVMF